MNKKEAVQLFVQRELQMLPQEWACIVSEHENEPQPFGMWGTVFLVSDSWLVDRIRKIAEPVYYNAEEAPEGELQEFILNNLNHDATDDDTDALYNSFDAVKERWPDLVEKFEDERCDVEMAGSFRVVGNIYAHDIADELVLSINAAGFDFYDETYGIWPRLYDALGLRWHDND